jgi:hypothetical protein
VLRFAANEKLVSRPRRFVLQSKSSEWSDLGGKTWWGNTPVQDSFCEPPVWDNANSRSTA